MDKLAAYRVIRKALRLAALFALLAAVPAIPAQAAPLSDVRPLAGRLDFSFDPSGEGTGGLLSGDASVNALVLQSDGKVVIGGNFATYNGTARQFLARANSIDGSLDTGFNAGDILSGANLGAINAVAIQPATGKILIGDAFGLSYNNNTHSCVQRLNPDGTLDTTFDPNGTGCDGYVSAFAVQADGKILIAGRFSFFDGVARNSIARLNANGTLDTTFGSGAANWGVIPGGSSYVNALAIQPSDGKVLVGGVFDTVSGQPRFLAARLTSSGALDTSFVPGWPAGSISGGIYAIVVQPDGKLLFGGSFHWWDANGTPDDIARTSSDGALDPDFHLNYTCTNGCGGISAVSLQPDGKILYTGDEAYAMPDGSTAYRHGIGRLAADGTLDLSFDPGSGTDGIANAMALQPDGKIVIGGGFLSYDGTKRLQIARVNGDGRHVYLPALAR